MIHQVSLTLMTEKQMLRFVLRACILKTGNETKTIGLIVLSVLFRSLPSLNLKTSLNLKQQLSLIL